MDIVLQHLYENKIIQFGEFVLKSGKTSPIYIDLRNLVSLRDARNDTANALYKIILEANIEFDYVIGVPYGAILLSEQIACLFRKPVLLIRKEAKSYGNKEMIIGQFEKGKKVLVIEDVVTTGFSILETVAEINKAGLCTEHVFCIVDREQGGPERLVEKRLLLHSLIQMTSILDFLVSKGIIGQERREEIQQQLQDPSTESIPNINQTTKTFQHLNLLERQKYFPKNSFNYKLINLMMKKKTNLCLAVDNFNKEQILKILESAKDFICVLKLHCDTIDGWDDEFSAQLQKISNENNFLIFEDRKLADTGNTMILQLEKGLKIAKWADVVTAYPFPGAKTFESLRKEIIESPNYKLSGILLLAELSTEGSKMDANLSVELAEKLGNNLISGFICQKRCSENMGVSLNKSTDGKGQKWRGPEQAILNDGCDIIIVGRGITEAENVEEEIKKYREIAWNAYVGEEK
uniref:Uridine 5'-monophosphate synthase n=1 Tax=Meloidogyne javanica TaxID=6303 RepID=A0A915MFL5_MELJA